MLSSIHKKIEVDKNGDKNEKAWRKLINNAVYSITTKNLRNKIDVKIVSNKKFYLK